MIAATPFFSDRGAHTQIYEQINSLQKKGFKIKLITYGIGRDVAGIETIRIGNIIGYKKISAGPSYTKFALLIFMYLKLVETINEFEPTIIHAHMFEGALLGKLYNMSHIKKFPLIIDLQGTLVGELLQHNFIRKRGLVHRFYRLIEKFLLNNSHIITQSDQMVQDFKIQSSRIKSITSVYDGVDVERFAPAAPDKRLADELGIDLNYPRILFMGYFSEYQGLNLLLDALRMLITKYPNLQLIAIGYPNIEKYSEIAKDLGIDKNIIFLGKINYFEVQNYLALSNIAIAPKISKTEGDGKIYNYMAMGQAVVAFDREISRDILKNCGLIAEFMNVKDLFHKISELLENEKKVIDLGRKARKRAQLYYSWDAVADRIEKQYKIVLQEVLWKKK